MSATDTSIRCQKVEEFTRLRLAKILREAEAIAMLHPRMGKQIIALPEGIAIQIAKILEEAHV